MARMVAVALGAIAGIACSSGDTSVRPDGGLLSTTDLDATAGGQEPMAADAGGMNAGDASQGGGSDARLSGQSDLRVGIDEATFPVADAAVSDVPVIPGGPCQSEATACGSGGGIRRCEVVGGRGEYGPEIACPDKRVCRGSAPLATCECPVVPPACQYGGTFACSDGKLTKCARDPAGCMYVVSETVCPGAANGRAACLTGECSLQCNTGFHACSGACVPDDSAEACGRFCMKCPSPGAYDPNAVAACVFNQCGFACKPGFNMCLGGCMSGTSIYSCGTGCRPCNPPSNAAATCDGIQCGFTCDQGFLRCGEGCIEAKGTDINNCGACGKKCLESCRGGVCQETKVALVENFDTDAGAWQYDGSWSLIVRDQGPSRAMRGASGGLMPCGPHDLVWTTPFSLTGATEATLAFAYESQGSINDEYQVVLSTDGGTTWQVAGKVPRFAGSWTTGTVNLGMALGQSSVRVGFRLLKSCMDTLVQWWNVDSVEVRVMKPVP